MLFLRGHDDEDDDGGGGGGGGNYLDGDSCCLLCMKYEYSSQKQIRASPSEIIPLNFIDPKTQSIVYTQSITCISIFVHF